MEPGLIVAFDDITLAIEESISPGDLQALTTIAGGEPVTRKDLEEAGHLQFGLPAMK